MTEQEWRSTTDPERMLPCLAGGGSPRKLRLCACAWARAFLRDAQAKATPSLAAYHFWLGSANWLTMFDAVERFADSEINRKEMLAAPPESFGGTHNFFRECGRSSKFSLASVHARLRLVQGEFGRPSGEEICDLLRDLFGPSLFHAVRLEPACLTWHNGLLGVMARRMYEARDFTDMPVLADALEEAGCQQQEILGHLRCPQPHVRGCWVLDLLVGKE